MNNNLFIQLGLLFLIRFAFKDNVSLHCSIGLYHQMVSTCKPSLSRQETPFFAIVNFKCFISNISCVAQPDRSNLMQSNLYEEKCQDFLEK